MTYLVYIANPEIEGHRLKNCPAIVYEAPVTYGRVARTTSGVKKSDRVSLIEEITVTPGINDFTPEQIQFVQEGEKALKRSYGDRFFLGIYRVVEADALSENQLPTGTLRDYSDTLCQILILSAKHRDIGWLQDNARSDPRPDIRKKCDQKIQDLRQTMTGAA